MILETGIFVRCEVEGVFDNFDIGDPALDDVQVLRWLRETHKAQGTKFYERLVLSLLGRNIAITEPGVVKE